MHLLLATDAFCFYFARMRYFAELAYHGARYNGWQKQAGQSSVQGTIEQAFSTILGTGIEVVGCGRTDAGVHARQYFLHFDFAGNFPKTFSRRVNKFLPADIAVFRIFEVAPHVHARYDACLRSYEYHINFNKDPFETGSAYFYPYVRQPGLAEMQQAASLLLEYEEFFPFCKSNTDVKTMKCRLKRAEWIFYEDNQKLIFYISSNRFLRGMVRLIVGMCLNIGLGKLPLQEVREAMETQQRLEKSYSVPPQGLFLTEVKYKEV